MCVVDSSGKSFDSINHAAVVEKVRSQAKNEIAARAAAAAALELAIGAFSTEWRRNQRDFEGPLFTILRGSIHDNES